MEALGVHSGAGAVSLRCRRRSTSASLGEAVSKRFRGARQALLSNIDDKTGFSAAPGAAPEFHGFGCLRPTAAEGSASEPVQTFWPGRCGRILARCGPEPELTPVGAPQGLPPGRIATALLRPLSPAPARSPLHLAADGPSLWQVPCSRHAAFSMGSGSGWQAARPSQLGYAEYVSWLESVLPDAELRPLLDEPQEDEDIPADATGLELLRLLAARKTGKKRKVPEITTEEQKLADAGLWGDGSPDEIVASRFNVEVTRRQLECLRPGEWLNDEVINFYYKLLQERGKSLSDAPKCWFTNSFFWPKLSGDNKEYNYKEVRRWTIKAKVDIFELDHVIFPMNIGNSHWAMGAIDLKAKGFRYFDSMFSNPPKNFVPFLQRYLGDEHKSKKGGKPFEGAEDWQLLRTEEPLPQQRNGFDCGVFTCCFGDCFSAGRPLAFDQDDMPDLRLRIASRVMKADENFGSLC
eukprot:TRINITY_DN92594_c0_g1_i1.p1 TRINITY_DN92594_c0_g1~~TRINITY_DN92594_c0_g1_i1.p1  ORF type:complete len:480 (+),score=93.91 TRINITY_DN92594_c0_g1_i1:50-1441(+)